MKKYTLTISAILFLVFLGANLSAQRIGNLHGINYQAVAIDEEGKEIVGMDIEGKPLYEKEIGVRFSILKGQDGATQYQETHTTLTDQYGLFSLVIGKGDQTGEGSYNHLLDMPWIDADQWLKVEIDMHNDGNYKTVSLQQLMTVPYSFYTDDIADDAITTEKILNEEILAEDIATGAVETSEILDETILAEDIATGAVETSEILDETILAEDIATGAVETSEILDETILAEDIATGAVETSEILNETILAEDIATGAVTGEELLDGTVQNIDIADGTIDLTAKVTNILPVANGGTGNGTLTDGGLLVGAGTGAIESLPVGTDGQVPIGVTGSNPVMASLNAGVGIAITQGPGSITISSGVQGVNSASAGSVNVGNAGGAGCPGERNIQPGETWISSAIPISGVELGNVIVGSINHDLQGCMMTTFVANQNIIKVAIFNGTGKVACFPGGLELWVLIVK